MNPFLDDMRAALELLETELKHAGWWQAQAPAAEKLASTEPFCVDTLTFSEWLQWVYTPKMHALMNQTGQLPAQSNLTAIAEEAWKNTVHAENLLKITALLDTIITGTHREHLASLQTTLH